MTMTANIAAIVLSFDAAHYAETTEALRKAEVSSENKRSDWGRETLLGLFGTDAKGKRHMTEGDLTAALVATFKPRKANGKPADTLSSLRNVKGGEAVRKAATLCLDIVDAATDGQIADLFRPIAIAFATDAPNAPKSLYALRDEMAKLRREAAKAAKGEESDSDSDDDSGDDSGEAVAATPLSVMADRMTLALQEASADDILAADDQLTALLAAIRDAFAVEVAEEAIAA